MESVRALLETLPDFWISGQVDQWLLGGKGMWVLVDVSAALPVTFRGSYLLGQWIGPALPLSFFCLSLQLWSGKRGGLFRRARHTWGASLWMKICNSEWLWQSVEPDSSLSRERDSTQKCQWKVYFPLENKMNCETGKNLRNTAEDSKPWFKDFLITTPPGYSFQWLFHLLFFPCRLYNKLDQHF